MRLTRATISAGLRVLTLWRVARYLAAGGSSFVLDEVLQWLLVVAVGIAVSVAATISYELALLAHFFATHRWVFGHRRTSWRRLVEFHSAALTAYAITVATTWLLSDGPLGPRFTAFFGSYALAGLTAKAIGTLLAFSWTFGSSFFWIWHPHRDERSPAPASAAGAAGAAAMVVAPARSHPAAD
jgi:putative flippase GtrA